MSTEVVLAILGTSSVGIIAGALINAVSSRRKLGADATEIITRAAAGVVESVNADNARLRAEQETDRREWKRVLADHAEQLRLHAEWDKAAQKELVRFGVVLPDPPKIPDPASLR